MTKNPSKKYKISAPASRSARDSGSLFNPEFRNSEVIKKAKKRKEEILSPKYGKIIRKQEKRIQEAETAVKELSNQNRELSKLKERRAKESQEIERLAKILAEKELEIVKIQQKRDEIIRKLQERTQQLESSRTALVNILEDVDENRKKAEEERNKTLTIIENFTDGLLVFDDEKRLSLINHQAEFFFDIKGRDIINRSIRELITFPTIKPFIISLGEETKRLSRKEFELKEGLILEISVIPIAREKGKSGTLIILHDISREKTIERMKTEFVSLAAHQLRTPLSAIKWTLRMLIDGDLGKINEDQRNFLEKTYNSNERMIELINDLLNVTRIEEGRYVYKPVLADLGSVIEFVVNSYKEDAERRKLRIEFKKPEKRLPQVLIDVEKIKLATQNLLDNAIRYSRPNGQIQVSLERNKDKIECSIKDNGLGIPKDQQNRVFTKFFRASNILRLETEGTGLGLFITKNIIEAHGGQIWFESEEGKGTTFYFDLPAKPEFEEFIAKL